MGMVIVVAFNAKLRPDKYYQQTPGQIRPEN